MFTFTFVEVIQSTHDILGKHKERRKAAWLGLDWRESPHFTPTAQSVLLSASTTSVIFMFVCPVIFPSQKLSPWQPLRIRRHHQQVNPAGICQQQKKTEKQIKFTKPVKLCCNVFKLVVDWCRWQGDEERPGLLLRTVANRAGGWVQQLSEIQNIKKKYARLLIIGANYGGVYWSTAKTIVTTCISVAQSAEFPVFKSNWKPGTFFEYILLGVSESQHVLLTKSSKRMAPCISSCCGLPLQKAVMLIGVAELVCSSKNIQRWGSQWYHFFCQSCQSYIWI